MPTTQTKEQIEAELAAKESADMSAAADKIALELTIRGVELVDSPDPVLVWTILFNAFTRAAGTALGNGPFDVGSEKLQPILDEMVHQMRQRAQDTRAVRNLTLGTKR